MELIIVGDSRKIKRLAKELIVRCKRNNLKLSLKDLVQKVKQPSVLNANQTAKLIVKCETVEDLKQFESDARQVVKAAYAKKLKELE